MKRVTIVNLAGRAWHVEDAGVTALDAWLADARTRLAADPDVDELIADFERAIDERFRDLAPGERDVVTESQVAGILAALGTVEPAEPLESGEPDAVGTEPPPSREYVPLRERKLYRLEGDDAMLGGVCAGLAAYLHVDVTVVRVLTVLLTLLTSGAVFLAYIVMWLIVPAASTPEQRAQARGAGLTAEEMLARARDGASPALARLGSLIGRLSVLLVHVVRWSVLVAVWALLVAWGLALGWLVVDPGALTQAFDPGTSAWLVGLWLTCVAWIPIAVLVAIERLLAMLVRRERPPRRTVSMALGATLTASFVLAIIGANAIPALHSEQLSGLGDGRGSVSVADHVLCIDDEDVRIDEDCPTPDRDR